MMDMVKLERNNWEKEKIIKKKKKGRGKKGPTEKEEIQEGMEIAVIPNNGGLTLSRSSSPSEKNRT